MHTKEGLLNLMKHEKTGRLGRICQRGAGSPLSDALDFV